MTAHCRTTRPQHRQDDRRPPDNLVPGVGESGLPNRLRFDGPTFDPSRDACVRRDVLSNLIAHRLKKASRGRQLLRGVYAAEQLAASRGFLQSMRYQVGKYVPPDTCISRGIKRRSIEAKSIG